MDEMQLDERAFQKKQLKTTIEEIVQITDTGVFTK